MALLMKNPSAGPRCGAGVGGVEELVVASSGRDVWLTKLPGAVALCLQRPTQQRQRSGGFYGDLPGQSPADRV